MANKLEIILKNIGLSEKAAKVYLASLDLGEAAVKDLANRSGLPRTTIYYTIDELIQFGALVETKRDKKTFYLPEIPRAVLKRTREHVIDFEDSLSALEERTHSAYPAPRTYFLYGVVGFKQIWDRVLEKPESNFDIITSGESFLPFVREKYILEEIIALKKKNKISSRQLIVDSRYARKIVSGDKQENRVSKILPAHYKLPYTTLISTNFVAFISPRSENMLIVIESESFAKNQRAIFNSLWDSLSKNS